MLRFGMEPISAVQSLRAKQISSFPISVKQFLLMRRYFRVKQILTSATYAATLILGEPEAIEHSDLRWVKQEDLGGMELAPTDERFVSECLSSDRG